MTTKISHLVMGELGVALEAKFPRLGEKFRAEMLQRLVLIPRMGMANKVLVLTGAQVVLVAHKSWHGDHFSFPSAGVVAGGIEHSVGTGDPVRVTSGGKLLGDVNHPFVADVLGGEEGPGLHPVGGVGLQDFINELREKGEPVGPVDQQVLTKIYRVEKKVQGVHSQVPGLDHAHRGAQGGQAHPDIVEGFKLCLDVDRLPAGRFEGRGGEESNGESLGARPVQLGPDPVVQPTLQSDGFNVIL